MTRITDHCCFHASRVTIEALFIALYGSFIGTVQKVPAEDVVELTDHDLHRSFDLERDGIEDHARSGVELSHGCGLLKTFIDCQHLVIRSEERRVGKASS